jgi:hypothetical protein
MAKEQTFTARIDKIKSLKRKLRLSNEQIAVLTDPPMDVREIELILEKEDSIYRDIHSVVTLEKALQEVARERGMDIINPSDKKE